MNVRKGTPMNIRQNYDMVTREGWLVCAKKEERCGEVPHLGWWYCFDNGNDWVIGKIVEIREGERAVRCEKIFQMSDAGMNRARYEGKWYARCKLAVM